MERQTFERLVRVALGNIPEDFRRRLENVDIIVEDWPSPDQLAGHHIDDDELLLGLYEGIPHTEREYLPILPDKITIFQGSIESICSTNEEIIKEIRKTVLHEVAHHFGSSDERLHELGL